MSGSGDRIRRFERLERARPVGSRAQERPGPTGRFEGLETGAGPPAEPRIPEAAGDRFRPPEERIPELERPPEDEQPFVRCARCQTDNGRQARQCGGCGEELRTEAQRAFNRELWAQRREEAAALERASLGWREAQRDAEEEAARARHLAAEELAREVGRQERERLDREQGGLLSRLADLLRLLLRP
jgi:hypothetical protein